MGSINKGVGSCHHMRWIASFGIALLTSIAAMLGAGNHGQPRRRLVQRLFIRRRRRLLRCRHGARRTDRRFPDRARCLAHRSETAAATIRQSARHVGRSSGRAPGCCRWCRVGARRYPSSDRWRRALRPDRDSLAGEGRARTEGSLGSVSPDWRTERVGRPKDRDRSPVRG